MAQLQEAVQAVETIKDKSVALLALLMSDQPVSPDVRQVLQTEAEQIVKNAERLQALINELPSAKPVSGGYGAR